jgi:hypothetical protein
VCCEQNWVMLDGAVSAALIDDRFAAGRLVVSSGS